MRIAFFSWESLHSIGVGGIAPHATELAAALQRRGHEVHIFTRHKEGQPGHEEIHGVHYHRCSFECYTGDFVSSMDNMANAFAWAFGETSAHIGGFDIAHAHDWMTCKAMVQAKNTHGLKCVFTFHSTESGRSGGDGQGDDRIKALEGEASFVADRVIGVSEKTRDEVMGLYSLPGDKVWAIPNGIQCSKFDGWIENPGEIKEMYGIGPLDPVVLFVGRMVGGMKGGDVLTEAIPSILGAHGGTKVIFVGEGDNKMHCDHRANELGIGGSVRFVGPKSGVELINLYKICDVVAVPSRYEPFGLVVLEGWAAGKPVVVTDRVGCKVDHGVDGWVVECSPDGVAWGISEVLKDFDRARDMGSKGRVKAAFSLSWDYVAEQTELSYHL